MLLYAKNGREDIDVKIPVKIRETLDGKAPVDTGAGTGHA